jgi:predicted RNA methylase
VKAFKQQRPNTEIHAYEIDHELCLKNQWIESDFLKEEPIKCDVVIGNPPFSSGRDDNANGRRGKDLSLAFLLKAFEWAPLVAFIMHQNKGNSTFAHQIYTARSDVALIYRECINKTDSVFETQKGKKFVPCAIYIYKTGQKNVTEPLLYKSIVCDDLELLSLNDIRCNLIVKSWGSMNRVGRVVTTNSNDILEEVAKQTTARGGVKTKTELICIFFQKTHFYQFKLWNEWSLIFCNSFLMHETVQTSKSHPLSLFSFITNTNKNKKSKNNYFYSVFGTIPLFINSSASR